MALTTQCTRRCRYAASLVISKVRPAMISFKIRSVTTWILLLIGGVAGNTQEIEKVLPAKLDPAQPKLVPSGYFLASCRDKACGFQAGFELLGNKSSGRAEGYCTHCKKVVKVYTKQDHLTGQRRGTSKSIGQAWDPSTNRLRFLFRCPSCTTPFFEIADIKDFVFCPKCSKATIDAQQTFSD